MDTPSAPRPSSPSHRPVPHRHDVIIVGARASGAATAMLLARAGLDVLVLDRGRYGADTLSTHALMRAAVVQLHRWGLLDHIVAAGTPPVRTTTFTYADDEIEVAVKPGQGIDALYAPRRTVLDPILVDAARAAGARVEYGPSVVSVTRDSSGRVDGVVARDARGATTTLRARWVIGADGVRSVIARAVDAPIERQGAGRAAFVYGYWSGLELNGYHWVFRPRAVAGLIPTNDGLTCVFGGGDADRIGRGGRHLLDEILRTASPAVAEQVARGTAPDGLRSFGGLPGYYRTPWGPGWALVGDAGYWKDPVSAHGLTDALRDAELLARAIIASATGTTSEADAFARYHRLRNAVSHELFEVTDRIAGGQWTDAEIPDLLRRLSLSMADEIAMVAALDEGSDSEPALIGSRP
jgi:2-polyprenyl-6-methoxyphenol hydroxylase-like FAD-dependent oxidoreductase